MKKTLSESILSNIKERNTRVLKESSAYYNWRNDIIDIDDLDDEEQDIILYNIAENISNTSKYEEERGQDPYSIMSNIINAFKINKNSKLYSYLVKWYGSEEKMKDSIRDFYEDAKAIYFVTGCNYAIFDKDLFGGDADGTTEKAFSRFVDNGGLREGVTIKDVLDVELEDDETPTGGTAFAGEKVRDFIEYNEETGEINNEFKLEDNLDKLNKELKACGIKPIKEAEETLARKSKLENIEIAKKIVDKLEKVYAESVKDIDSEKAEYSTDILSDIWQLLDEVSSDEYGTYEDMLYEAEDEAVGLPAQDSLHLKMDMNETRRHFIDLIKKEIEYAEPNSKKDIKESAKVSNKRRLTEAPEDEYSDVNLYVKGIMYYSFTKEEWNEMSEEEKIACIMDTADQASEEEGQIVDEDEVDIIRESAKPSNKKRLIEAPEDEEEFEVVDEPTEEIPEAPMELPEEPEASEEMSQDEVAEEAEEDNEDTIKDDIELPFYATTEEFDELRDILVDLDYRLFLINDNMVCIGRLNGADIEFLTSNNHNADVEKSEQNDTSDEIEERATEDGENSYEYLWIKAPETLDKFLDQINVVYLSPDMSEEDKEQYAGLEASHDSVMEYLMNELPEDVKEEKEENLEDTFDEEMIIEEPEKEEDEDEE